MIPSMDAALHTWFPRLIALWRKIQGRKSSTPWLTPDEINRVSQGVQRLSQGLTRDRQLSGKNYFSDPAALGAYLLFYWPVSYCQAFRVLQTMPELPSSLLELGSAAGPLSMAAWDLGIRHLAMADRNPEMLALGKQLAQSAHATVQCTTWDPQRQTNLPPGQFDLISLQHVLNELWLGQSDRLLQQINLVESLRRHLRPTGQVLLIEPALTVTSRDLINLRNQLLNRKWHLAGPCPFNGPCPVLAKPADTCHLDFSWTPPEFLKQSINLAGFQKKELKMTYFILRAAAASPAPANEIFLIVSEKLRSKNEKIRVMACGQLGRVSIALHPKDLSKQNRIFLELRRGDRIRISHAQTAENGWRLTAESQIHKI